MEALVKPCLEALKVLCPCGDFAKYVCNAMSAHSRCCAGDAACECDLETEAIDLPSEAEPSEFSLDLGHGCCELRNRG